MVVWWKQAREELRAPSSRTAEMVGDKLDPDWAISARSSVLRSLVGQDSWELYKACLLECDQVLLAQTAHTRVEEHIAYVLTQVMAFSHDLSLKCSMFRHQKGVAESRVTDLQKEISEAKQKVQELFDAKAALEVENANLIAQLHWEVGGRALGVTEGRKVFLCSDECKKMTATYRLKGAQDFLKTPTFRLAVDIQSARFLNEVDHLKGFVNEFDRTHLGPSLDVTLQLYPEEATPSTIVADEFEAVAAEVGCPIPL
ncbi:hypothetical protein Salat_0638200 [Sesamum alatum]|uniref:Uncharacterized protein n=1 Tax=Sesamum alatum TaxID=300844 RepID=A0AAE1YRN2_9LAMI|nr:hypothetical protein Salat_0638200 [Sesamum alatum]